MGLWGVKELAWKIKQIIPMRNTEIWGEMWEIQYQKPTWEGSKRLRAGEEWELRLSTGIPSRNGNQFSKRACAGCGIFFKTLWQLENLWKSLQPKGMVVTDHILLMLNFWKVFIVWNWGWRHKAQRVLWWKVLAAENPSRTQISMNYSIFWTSSKGKRHVFSSLES